MNQPSELSASPGPLPPESLSAVRRGTSASIRAVPTLVVLAGLIGIGLWGHNSGWKIPKFSALLGNEQAEEGDWCLEHNVPESKCIACNAGLMPKSELFGWCAEHGVHECLMEHPELAQLKTPTTLLPADVERARRALELRDRPENNPQCNLHLRRIQFTSNDAVLRTGIEVDLVERGPIVETITASGEITFDGTRVAHLSSRVPGTVWRAEKKVGDRVRQGDLLLLVDAAVVGQAKGDLLQALVQAQYQKQNHARLANLSAGVVAGREIREALTAMRDAEVRLLSATQALINLGLPVTVEELEGLTEQELARRIQFLGLPPALVEQLDTTGTTANLLPVTAPQDGVVVARDVVAGEVVGSEKVLFVLADPRQMWLTLDVQLEDIQTIAIGQEVVFRPDGQRVEAKGTISWISSAVDRSTRTVQVRAEIANGDGLLRDETFGTGEIMIREEADAIRVLSDAVHWEGCCHVAFVQDARFFSIDAYQVFHARSVRPGVTNGEFTEVIAGLLPGEVVVTTGSAALRAELLKGNLGAG